VAAGRFLTIAPLLIIELSRGARGVESPACRTAHGPPAQLYSATRPLTNRTLSPTSLAFHAITPPKPSQVPY